MKTGKISIQEYAQFCAKSDLSPNYHPVFVEYYFQRLGMKPQVVGVFDKRDNLVAAFPTLFRQVFPNPIHARLLGKRFKNTCFIGQPESLFPVNHSASMMRLGHLSPTTSPLLEKEVRRIGDCSLKAVAIAKTSEHKRVARYMKTFLEKGGKVLCSDAIESHFFSETFVQLHCERWGYPAGDFGSLRQQISCLYDYVLGTLLFLRDEPVAAVLCYCVMGNSIYYVDAISSAAKLKNNASYGSIALLSSLRRAEAEAARLGKKLRYSMGYYYGDRTYKAIWAEPQRTYVAF